MKIYALGFLFDEQGDYVLLIRKNRPAFQAGKYNGIGGLCDDDESALDCIVRECHEEMGRLVKGWEHFYILNFGESRVHCFYTFSDDLYRAEAQTDEELIKSRVDRLPDNMVKDARELIHLAVCEERLEHYRKEAHNWKCELTKRK